MKQETWQKHQRPDGTWAILHVNKELGSSYQIMACGSEAIADMVLADHNAAQERDAYREALADIGCLSRRLCSDNPGATPCVRCAALYPAQGQGGQQ